MVDNRKGLIEPYTYDGVHPSKLGYTIMESLLDAAIGATHEK